ncbi:LOW QUALITY PROTEIN: hypothetical protein V1477_004784 [Vespula maculifrons]|uniref:Uncharacterized protein n=1 Tax=Vespula maculifrons TaxID=7453 RepID=A0ABD2CNY4_VESMC
MKELGSCNHCKYGRISICPPNPVYFSPLFIRKKENIIIRLRKVGYKSNYSLSETHATCRITIQTIDYSMKRDIDRILFAKVNFSKSRNTRNDTIFMIFRETRRKRISSGVLIQSFAWHTSAFELFLEVVAASAITGLGSWSYINLSMGLTLRPL